MNATDITRELEELAGAGVPEGVDLWPRLRAQAVAHPRRRATPRRRTIGVLATTVAVLALLFAGLAPRGTNAATAANDVLTFFGFQPIAVSLDGPSCVGENGRVEPLQLATTGAPDAFAVVAATGEPLPAGAVQGVQLGCPAGYELAVAEGTNATDTVLLFLGFPGVASSSATPSCANESGRVAPIEIAPGPGTPLTSPPTGATQGVQIGCPAGYELVFGEK